MSALSDQTAASLSLASVVAQEVVTPCGRYEPPWHRWRGVPTGPALAEQKQMVQWHLKPSTRPTTPSNCSPLNPHAYAELFMYLAKSDKDSFEVHVFIHILYQDCLNNCKCMTPPTHEDVFEMAFFYKMPGRCRTLQNNPPQVVFSWGKKKERTGLWIHVYPRSCSLHCSPFIYSKQFTYTVNRAFYHQRWAWIQK